MNRYVYIYISRQITWFIIRISVVIIVPIIIDMEKCGQIKDCPLEGICIKICEQGALEKSCKFLNFFN